MKENEKVAMKALLSTGTVRILAALLVLAVGMILGPQAAQAFTVGPSVDFAIAANYDNTANTVTGNPLTVHDNQTFGLMRDVFFWRINNGNPAVGSPDFINTGNSLILVSNHAVPGAGPFKALNFTGPSISGGQSYLALYDTTVGNVAPKSTFSATGGGLEIFADFLFVKHSTSGGLVALYDDGASGLALLANQADGSNQDHTRVNLIFQNGGTGTVLAFQNLDDATFCTATDGSGAGGPACTTGDHWYRIVMDVTVDGAGNVNVAGKFFNHLTPADPTSDLGSLITTLNYSGTVAGLGLTEPGEIGLIVQGNESISLPDNVGVSVYCFNGCTAKVPEPASLLLLGSGLVGLAAWRWRRRNA